MLNREILYNVQFSKKKMLKVVLVPIISIYMTEKEKTVQ